MFAVLKKPFHRTAFTPAAKCVNRIGCDGHDLNPVVVHDPLRFFEGASLKRRRISAGITVCPLAVIVLLILSSRMNYILRYLIIQFATRVKKSQ